MKEKYGIILLDHTEIVIRIYEVSDTEWKLLHYHDDQLIDKETIDPVKYAEAIAAFLTTEAAQHVIEWKVCARDIDREHITKLASMIGLPIECLTPVREQELLSKGIFTELW